MNHKAKVKLARTLMTKKELVTKGNPNEQKLFGTQGWLKRKEAIRLRVKKQTDAALKHKQK